MRGWLDRIEFRFVSESIRLEPRIVQLPAGEYLVGVEYETDTLQYPVADVFGGAKICLEH